MQPDGVSPREREVLDLLGDQLTHAQIAQRLFISVRTVESHVASLRRKLDLPDHRDLVRLATKARAARPAGGAPPPVPLTSFVGRQAEVAELRQALEASRLVTAVGPGGAGKTRLALAAVEERPVIWADLVPVTDPAVLDEVVAQACGAVPTSRLTPLDAAIAELRPAPVLLVLDNAEHLVNAVAVLVERLLSECPQLRVLVTSRVRLALPFERVFRVAGLRTEEGGDAVALFVARAVAAGADAPGGGDAERISAICAALGGLALAIELAAVRLPALGLDAVERGLLDQPSLLTAGARLSPRHHSMNGALDWSVALLDPLAAACLRRLAVFVAPFDAGAAMAVAGFAPVVEPDVGLALVQLTEHNLIAASTQDGRRVYRMLEPVRQYGLAGLMPDDAGAFERHLAWCGRSADELLERDEPELAPVADDVRAALARAEGGTLPVAPAAALARAFALLLYRDGSLREAQLRFEQAATFTDEPRQAAIDWAAASGVAKCRVLGEEALRIDLAAAEAAAAAGAPVAAALALSRAAELLNRFPGMFAAPPDTDGLALLERARQLGGDDPWVVAAVGVAAVGYAGPHGVPTVEAATYALELARTADDPLLQSAALDALIAAHFADDVVAAHRLAAERLGQLPGWRDDPAAGLELKDALHVAVFAALGAGDLPAAADAARRQQAMPILRERRDLAEDELIAPAALAGDFETARTVADRFLQDWTEAGRPPAPGRALLPSAAALAYGLCGDVDGRERWLDVVGEFRAVPREEASRGSGHGELFEAMVLLHQDRAVDAFAVATAPGDRGLFGLVFAQWTAAVAAEAAVLAGRPDADHWVERAHASTAGNPLASLITARAAALLAGADLLDLVPQFRECGSPYQAERTERLASAHRSA